MELDRIIANGHVPDFIFRSAIRRELRKHYRSSKVSPEALQKRLTQFIDKIEKEDIAIYEKEANEQHYEVPTEFFQVVLGKRLKYSSCLWDNPNQKRIPSPEELDRAEEAMLKMTVERADLSQGQQILELGCGWGSLSLYMAEKFPESEITAVSNSRTQKEFIDKRAMEKHLTNLNVITHNVEDMALENEKYHRIVSIEMFEHMRNYKAFMKKLYALLVPGGKMFVHIFSFQNTPYHFDAKDAKDWMARHFFAGGTMPNHELLPYCSGPFSLDKSWIVPGTHYGYTLRAWLKKMDGNNQKLKPLFEQVYKSEARAWWNNWRAFFIICEELFHFRKGQVWMVSHYLFSKEIL